ncbi:MAG: hypothetical protein HRU38_05720 [Saccharospirillaceae bacterium]|nr:hypothetical protein [Pseudomonadales bacterium]NRB78154.1 hypothetical protein [Saccharospirillaceae bacterium]
MIAFKKLGLVSALALSACGGSDTSPDTDTNTISNTATDTQTAITPTISIGDDFTVNEKELVKLIALISDFEGESQEYTWTQTSGTTVILDESVAGELSFAAPDVSETETLTFEVSVSAADGTVYTDTISVEIKFTEEVPNNVAPIVSAGEDFTSGDNITVTVTGSSEDSDGSVDSILWTQTAGSTVTLSNADMNVFSFDAPVVTEDETFSFELSATDNSGDTSTDSVDVLVSHTNIAPTVDAGNNINSADNTTVELTGSVMDADGSIASMVWTQISGSAVILTNADMVSASFVAPITSGDETFIFELSATDSDGETNTDSVTVFISHNNIFPTANAGDDFTTGDNQSVTVTGSADDTDGSVASIVWTQTAGSTVVLTNADLVAFSFDAPVVVTDETFGFQISVTDNQGDVSTDTVDVVITHTNVAPIADAGDNIPSSDDTTVTLNGMASDSDGSVASILWTQTSGTILPLTDTSILTPSFDVPVISGDKSYIFELSVTDNDGEITTDSVTVFVSHGNIPPTANAGDAFTTGDNTTVTVNGSADDIDGSVTSIAWTLTSGQTITLINADMATFSFDAPTVTTDETFSFTMSVTDNSGSITTDTVDVSVTHTNLIPTVNAGSDITSGDAINITVTGSASDADGSIVSYAWAQTLGQSVVLTNANMASFSFDAPSNLSDQTLTFELTATDDAGEMVKDSVNVNLTHTNVAPTIVLTNMSVGEGTLVLINSDVYDLENSIASYQWTQLTGDTLALTNQNTASLAFTAPLTVTLDVYQFSLTVTDSDNATTVETVNVTVNPNNQVPVISITGGISVDELSTISLSSTATDDRDLSELTYVWSANNDAVLTGETTATVNITAPIVAAQTDMVITLAVTDLDGDTTTKQHTITILPIDSNPTAMANIDQSVVEQTLVTLNGSGSDFDGDIVSYAWTLVSGSAVVLSNSTLMNPTFDAPTVLLGSTEELVFDLVVTDNEGLSSEADSVTITVTPVNLDPTIDSITYEDTFQELELVVVSSTASDADGTFTYAWTQSDSDLNQVNLPDNQSDFSFFSVEQLGQDLDYHFTLTVTDNEGIAVSQSIVIHIMDINRPAVISLTSDNGSYTVKGLETFFFTENYVDFKNPNDTVNKHGKRSLVQIDGTDIDLIARDQGLVTWRFEAPDVISDTIVIRFTYTDYEEGEEAYIVQEYIEVTVLDRFPALTTQTALTVDEKAAVNMTVAVELRDMVDTATIQWTQLDSDYPVVLSNSTDNTTSFTAPTVPENTDLVFEVEVTSSTGSVTTETVTVTILNLTPTPVANFITTLTGELYFDAEDSYTYPERSILSYQWILKDGDDVRTIHTSMQPDESSIDLFELCICTDTTKQWTLELRATDDSGSTFTSESIITVPVLLVEFNDSFVEFPRFRNWYESLNKVYELTLNTDQQINLDYIAEGYSEYFFLLDSNGDRIVTSSNYNGAGKASIVKYLQAGTYYISLTGNAGDTNFDYTLNVYTTDIINATIVESSVDAYK